MITFTHFKRNQRRLGWKRLTRKTVRRYFYWENQGWRLVKRGHAKWDERRENFVRP